MNFGRRGGVAHHEPLRRTDVDERVERRLPHVAGRGGGLVLGVHETVDVLEGGDADGPVDQPGRQEEPLDPALVGATVGGREAEGLVRHLTPTVEGALSGYLASGGEALHRPGGEEVRLRGELDLLQLGFIREARGRLGSWTETVLCTRR